MEVSRENALSTVVFLYFGSCTVCLMLLTSFAFCKDYHDYGFNSDLILGLSFPRPEMLYSLFILVPNGEWLLFFF